MRVNEKSFIYIQRIKKDIHISQVLTDDTQQAIWQVESQTPFGELEINEDPDGDGRDIVFNVRFLGQYYDSESNTSYNYFRTYDQSLERYIQSDPIGYVGGNPLGYIDSLDLNR